ncbi:MAG: hypothetical protein PHY56_04945 [Candidatus Omnitrophica bacterium]|jgi:hypothetical protein|nr:hypothetical protein [Candidatus Omnitrophota bacterium]
MIFRTKPKAVWVSGANAIFDDSELKLSTEKERRQIAFLLNPYTPEKLRELTEKNKIKAEMNDLAVNTNALKALLGNQEEVDTIARNNDAVDFVVADWKGITDEDGKTLPCTRDNKINLAKNGYPLLAARWLEAARWLMSRFDKFMVEWEEEQIKNSEPSQGGLKDEV